VDNRKIYREITAREGTGAMKRRGAGKPLGKTRGTKLGEEEPAISWQLGLAHCTNMQYRQETPLNAEHK